MISPTEVGAGVAFIFTSWQAYRANRNAHRANQQTKATGNGFAKHTAESLARLEQFALEGKEADRRIEGKIDRHIEDHAEADLRRR